MTNGEPEGRPLIYAHRGDTARCPENTMAAFRAAVALGVDAVELDVHQTSDGHLVVIHDYNLDRTTDGTGLVHERELAYVRSLSAGAWRGDEFGDEKVPLLEDVLALDGVEFELELKGVPTKSLVEGVAGAVRDARVTDRLKLTSFHLLALAQLHAAVPEARLGLFAPAWLPWMSDDLFEAIAVAHALTGGAHAVHFGTPLLGKLRPARIRRSGLELLTNPVTDDELRLAVGSDVDVICTDNPALALALLDHAGPPRS